MRDEDKQEYLEKYAEEKRRGIPFFPDALFKDALVAVGVFVVLVVLAATVGSVLGERADPTAEYDPRPEWYFLFIFQLLKHFPGNLEFVGAVVLPLVVVGLLVALPWLDRSPRRHITARPIVAGAVVVLGGAAVVLTIQSLMERPAPSGLEAQGDAVAALYVENCAGCHGGALTVPASVDLTSVIAAGGHDGMPAWSADLSADEIDALAGFILSPSGSAVFAQSCAECHRAEDLTESSPAMLREVLDPESGFAPHQAVELPTSVDRTALLNFLIAPDGQRLYALNCSECHGSAVAFAGEREELRDIIVAGGGHLDMPAMGNILSGAEIGLLAGYIVDPNDAPEESVELFRANCTVCHGTRFPAAVNLEAARQAIETGGGHETMPVWGQVLTDEQIDALTDYALETARGTPLILGAELYAQYCTLCHGDFGEGGANPANRAQIIAPISTASYLRTRDDATIRAIIAQGQPDLGMAPFSLSFGGLLDEEDLDALVAYIRAWEADPPVELPPEIRQAPLIGSAEEIFGEFCAQCHGGAGEGGIGPSFQDPAFQALHTDDEMVDAIGLGHAATAMIAWGEVLSDEQIRDLVEFIRTLEVSPPPAPGDTQPPPRDVSFSADILPLFEAECAACHGIFGGWSADNHRKVISSGDNAPVIIPGDPDGSLLVQLMQATDASVMPPAGALSQRDIQLVIDWIRAGALDN